MQGATHPDTSATLLQLVALLRGANKAANALPLAQRCLSIKRQARAAHAPTPPLTAPWPSMNHGTSLIENLTEGWVGDLCCTPFARQLACGRTGPQPPQGPLPHAEAARPPRKSPPPQVFGESHPEVAAATQTVGEVMLDLGRYSEVEKLCGRAASMLLQGPAPARRAPSAAAASGAGAPAAAGGLRPLLVAQTMQALALVLLGRPSEAEPLARGCLTMAEEQLPSEGPAAPERSRLVASASNCLSEALRELGRLEDAEAACRAGLALREKVRPTDGSSCACGLRRHRPVARAGLERLEFWDSIAHGTRPRGALPTPRAPRSSAPITQPSRCPFSRSRSCSARASSCRRPPRRRRAASGSARSTRAPRTAPRWLLHSTSRSVRPGFCSAAPLLAAGPEAARLARGPLCPAAVDGPACLPFQTRLP